MTEYVMVPRTELAKLEAARVKLHSVCESVPIGLDVLMSITDTMWYLANRKWEAAPQQAAEPVAWISIVQCVGPDYGKERYGKLPVQSLQPGYYRHVPLYAGQPPAQPEQRFQQIGFTRIDRIGRPSAMIISDTKYRAASDAGVYVPVFVGEGDTQAPAVGDAVQQSCAECGPVDDGTALYCVRCVERMGLPAPMPETIKQH